LKNYGERFLQAISDYCRRHGVAMDVNPTPARPAAPSPAPASAPRVNLRPNLQRTQAFALFRDGAVIEDVMHSLGRARTTVVDYLCDFIRQERPASIANWLPDTTYHLVASAARKVGTERLKPIFIALGEKVSYDDIRLVLAHLVPTQQAGSTES
jgi:ATP-dependent DNA helicase RecQ